MTTVDSSLVSCSICGKSYDQPFITSTNSFGYPDLDMRPPEMERSTILYKIHRCKSCGYCATDLRDYDPRIKSIIQSEEYRRQLKNKAYKETANSFLCHAMISEQTGYYFDAVWASIHAAWICDTWGKQKAAMECRRKALAPMEYEEMRSDSQIRGNDDYILIKVDLMRRAGMFDETLAFIKKSFCIVNGEQLHKVLLFQKSLCEQKDVNCYTFESVV